MLLSGGVQIDISANVSLILNDYKFKQQNVRCPHHLKSLIKYNSHQCYLYRMVGLHVTMRYTMKDLM